MEEIKYFSRLVQLIFSEIGSITISLITLMGTIKLLWDNIRKWFNSDS
ncbi:MAG: hypothetical protein AAFX87_00705 [Bacteroidota bacterium]